MNFLDVLLNGNAASLKVFQQGSGTISTPSGTSIASSTLIPHQYGSDKLLWQVSLRASDTGKTYITPLLSGDGRYNLRANLDVNNLHIAIDLNTSGTAFPAITWTYTYRIIIP